MISCRVYLFTYKRDNLLPRAIQSLINQTFTNWVCEVHNDCPENTFPAEYIRSLNDARFVIKNHEVNLGAVAGFNLAFAGCNEQYASILEDDNWWEPTFLAEMIQIMETQTNLKMVWSNMNLWEETKDNTWTNTGKSIWPVNNSISVFSFPQPQQALGALHSNGAMLYRGNYAKGYTIPQNVLFNAVELIRERLFEHPIAMLNKPLANFAITLSTARSDDAYLWIGTQIMMLASFIKSSNEKQKTFRQTLAYYRTQKPTPVANFFLANFLIIKDRSLYTFFSLTDWIIICKWFIKNGHKLGYIKKYITSQSNVYSFLLQNTALRYAEAENLSPKQR